MYRSSLQIIYDLMIQMSPCVGECVQIYMHICVYIDTYVYVYIKLFLKIIHVAKFKLC